MMLPNCPCCGEDGLRLADYNLKNGYLHYKVECLLCGVEFHHEKFYGINEVEKFFEATGRGECEDIGGDDEFECSRCGYRHDYTPAEMEDPKAFSFCPTCGAEVQR